MNRSGSSSLSIGQVLGNEIGNDLKSVDGGTVKVHWDGTPEYDPVTSTT